MVVASAVVADTGVPPELVSEEATQQHVGVVELVIVADPGADESPGGFDSWVSRKESSLCWLATYAHTLQIRDLGSIQKVECLPRAGLDQRFLGASLAVEGV